MAKSVPDMEKEPKMMDPYGLSRAREGEVHLGNFKIEPTGEFREKGKEYANEVVEQIEETGEYNNVRYKDARTDIALDENGETIIGERAIFVTPVTPNEKLY